MFHASLCAKHHFVLINLVTKGILLYCYCSIGLVTENIIILQCYTKNMYKYKCYIAYLVLIKQACVLSELTLVNKLNTITLIHSCNESMPNLLIYNFSLD